MKKTILFVVNDLNYDIHNRKSAIDSILCSILEELSSDYIIYVNDKKFVKSQNHSTNTIYRLSNSNSFKRYIPAILKRNYNDYNYVRSNTILFERIIKNDTPHVIIELMRYGSKIGVMLKKHFNIPLIAYFDAPSVEERNFFNNRFSFFDRIADKYEEETIQLAEEIIVYTSPIIDYWCKRLANISEKKFNIFQTLDYSRLDFVTEKNFNDIPVIGFIGSFLKWHRIDMLINAFNKIREEGILAKLLLVGAGEEFDYIMTCSKNSKYSSDIELTGFVDGEKLKEYRKKIDIGVMSGTHWYCMPTKVFEYGAAMIPALAPRTDNMRFLFKEGEDLMMFEQGNEDELYKMLKVLVTSLDKKKQLSNNLNELVFKRNSRVIAKQFYKNLIDKLL